VKTVDRAATLALTEIRELLGLSEAELADLFSVQRSSVVGWREHGIPAARAATVERVHDLAKALHRELIPSRIPEIVRTPDEWLGGRSVLQTIRIEGAEAVYGYLRKLFSYSR
jgi:transcriptional regulator with XRE-family HTH domain